MLTPPGWAEHRVPAPGLSWQRDDSAAYKAGHALLGGRVCLGSTRPIRVRKGRHAPSSGPPPRRSVSASSAAARRPTPSRSRPAGQAIGGPKRGPGQGRRTLGMHPPKYPTRHAGCAIAAAHFRCAVYKKVSLARNTRANGRDPGQPIDDPPDLPNRIGSRRMRHDTRSSEVAAQGNGSRTSSDGDRSSHRSGDRDDRQQAAP